jgi:primosomal protein N' (replication factor Y)
MAIAKVEPLTTARALRGPFDYRLPESMTEVEVGSVLLVPFGRRRVLGVVVEVAERSELPPERLAEPIEALEAGVPPELVRLGLWVGREYCSTPSRGLGLVLPPGTGSAGQRTRARMELEAELTERGVEAAPHGSDPAGGRLGVRQRAVLRALAAGPRRAGELAAEAGAERATLRRLEQRDLIDLRRVEQRRRPRSAVIGATAGKLTMTPPQRRAADRVGAAIGGESGPGFLLHGVTGSGKTEVYMEVARAALEAGRGVIVLVPEIALTPQTMERFRARFGETVALLHSAMPAGARYDEWRRLRSGEARLCIGPRSAVFAPVFELGLVVVDEEHDSSYAQESDPRYDAREVARRRAAESGAVLLCGSATPRPESWLELERLELPERIDGRRLPPVQIVDMRGHRGGPLHPRTAEALGEVASAGGKAIVLINRRGWAPHLACRSCGRAWGCPHCEVSLVAHRRQDSLLCHHCGHSEPVPRSCPDCGSVTLARLGAGSERIEAELARLLEPLPVLRLDSDTTSAAGAHIEILREFDRAEAGVLVGTQMVAKGHDFPEVTLGVVLDADATLRFPDFRSEERTFGLITQLAGRSGRGAAGGKVLVQTLAPRASSIRRAARHDAGGFLAEELERRRALRYPPFAELIEVELSAADESRAEEAARLLAELLDRRLPAGAERLGPAPLFRLRGRFRRRLLVKAGERAPAVKAVRETVDAAVAERRALRGVALSVDVDPQ